MKSKRTCEFWIRGTGYGVLENPRHSLAPNTTCLYHLQVNLTHYLYKLCRFLSFKKKKTTSTWDLVVQYNNIQIYIYAWKVEMDECFLCLYFMCNRKRALTLCNEMKWRWKCLHEIFENENEKKIAVWKSDMYCILIGYIGMALSRT